VRTLFLALLLPLLALPLRALPQSAASAAPSATVQAPRAQERPTETDEYSLYELLDPESASFHILYEVTAIDPGATVFFNPIRKGSAANGESIRDRATSKPLQFEQVSGAEARRSGYPEAELDTDYIRIHLPRPVPKDGGGIRLLIEKTYKDPKSYLRKGADRIVFTRTLGIRRNAIVMPAGYEVLACNVPAQILGQPDGRSRVSLMHTGPEALPVTIEARKLTAAKPVTSVSRPATSAALGSGEEDRLSERAHQDRTIVYFLQPPETHAFDLYHDYTESRPGVDRYLNVVRKGSAASKPSARELDTGETLPVETRTGAELRKAGLHTGETADEVPADSDVVVIRFPPVPPGGSVRLRITETYTDPKSYRLEGDELVFDRTFGRPRDAVVLPAGWSLTASSIPAMVSESPDGRVRLDFVNPRNDEIAVLIKARRRPAGP
jgi:hypothetical protein